MQPKKRSYIVENCLPNLVEDNSDILWIYLTTFNRYNNTKKIYLQNIRFIFMNISL